MDIIEDQQVARQDYAKLTVQLMYNSGWRQNTWMGHGINNCEAKSQAADGISGPNIRQLLHTP